MDARDRKLIQQRISDLWEKTDFTSTLFQTLVGYSVIAADFDGNILAFNEGARMIFGYEPTEVIGIMSIDTFFPFVADDEKDFLIKSLMGQERVNYEGEFTRKLGEHFPGTMLLTLTRTSEGVVEGFVQIVEDLTERHQTESRIMSQNEKLQQRNSELAALHEIANSIGRSLDLQELVDGSLNTITNLDLMNMSGCGIFMVSDERLELVSVLGHDDEFFKAHANLKVGECLCGRVAERGKLIISNNSLYDERHTINYPGIKPHGHVIVPLKVAARVVGVMFLDTKPNSDYSERQIRILESIGNQLGIAIDNSKLYEKAKTLSLHDPLTELGNRNLMSLELNKNVAWTKRNNKCFAVIMLDLDYFKKFNDKFGHSTGDNLLIEIARIIRKDIRDVDLAVRYGGEEFLIIMPDTGAPHAFQVAERIRKDIETTSVDHTSVLSSGRITISAGVAEVDVENPDSQHIVKEADMALYEAKNNGRNRTEMFKKTCEVRLYPASNHG